MNPNAPQRVVDPPDKSLLAFERVSLTGGQRIVVVTNLREDAQSVALEDLGIDTEAEDLISGAESKDGRIEMEGYQTVWLTPAG